MAEQDERRRILDMLASGQINADEAEELLGALGSESESEVDFGTAVHNAAVGAVLDRTRRSREHRQRRISRSLRITIESGGDEQGKRERVVVTVPLALAKFAGKLIPQEVRVQLDAEGIEIAELLEALDQDLPEGRLVDIDTNGGDGGKRERIIVEVA